MCFLERKVTLKAGRRWLTDIWGIRWYRVSHGLKFIYFIKIQKSLLEVDDMNKSSNQVYVLLYHTSIRYCNMVKFKSSLKSLETSPSWDWSSSQSRQVQGKFHVNPNQSIMSQIIWKKSGPSRQVQVKFKFIVKCAGLFSYTVNEHLSPSSPCQRIWHFAD